jgi:hypothetical protein
MENSHIGWTHNTQNFWLGCDKSPDTADWNVEAKT